MPMSDKSVVLIFLHLLRARQNQVTEDFPYVVGACEKLAPCRYSGLKSIPVVDLESL